MLNEESRHRVQTLKELVEIYENLPTFKGMSIDDVKWLINTLIEMDDRYKEHKDCCLHEFNCKFGEELPNA